MKTRLLKKLRRTFKITYLKKPCDNKPILLTDKFSLNFRCPTVESAAYHMCYMMFSREKFKEIYTSQRIRKLKRNKECLT